MAKPQQAIEREIVAELGERAAGGLKQHAPTRLFALLNKPGSDWDKAFEHISDHFRRTPDKPAHTVYAERYRDKEALRKLLLDAASVPSEVRLTKLKIHGDNMGKPAIEIRRWFNKQVGDNQTLTWLRIFVDFQGNLITAYPDDGTK